MLSACTIFSSVTINYHLSKDTKGCEKGNNHCFLKINNLRYDKLNIKNMYMPSLWERSMDAQFWILLTAENSIFRAKTFTEMLLPISRLYGNLYHYYKLNTLIISITCNTEITNNDLNTEILAISYCWTVEYNFLQYRNGCQLNWFSSRLRGWTINECKIKCHICL